MRSGSGSTRTTRGWPPMSWARLASGTSESSCASSAASGRRRSLDQPSPHSVRRQERHVVDRVQLDDRRQDAARQAPAHCRLPLVDLDQARLVRLVDLEADGDQRAARGATPSRRARLPATPHRIRSIGATTRLSTSAGSAPGHATITSTIGTRICGSSSRGVARSASAPEAEGGRDDERRELAVEEGLRRPCPRTRRACSRRPARGRAAPSASPAGSSTTRSPASTPARISTEPPSRAPAATQRSRALPSAPRRRP